MNKNSISEKFKKFLELKNYTKNTTDVYCFALNKFLDYNKSVVTQI